MMMFARLVIICVALSGSTWAVYKPPSSFFHGLRVPPSRPLPGNAANITMDSIEQKLDHYDPTSTATWRQRYYWSTSYYKTGGPVFLFIDGEITGDGNQLQSGQMADLAAKYGALTFELEHRYYGTNHPTEDMSTESLRYLTVEQALADAAYFIDHMNKNLELNGTKWILFGGSYAGNLVTWMRLKYPHLVHGAVASSAPVQASMNCTSYFEVVGSQMKAVSSQCYDDVKNATTELNELLQTEEGSKKVAKIFNFCHPMDIKNRDDIYFLQSSLAGNWANPVQYGEPDVLLDQCNTVTDPKNGATPLERYASLSNSGECSDTKFSDISELLANSSWDSPLLFMRAWIYQCCTGVGMFVTSDSPNQPFSGFPLQFFIDECKALFGNQINEDIMMSAEERTNILYGGKHPEVTNVLFVHGSVDPWRMGGVLEDLNPNATVIIIEGLTHVQDMDAPKDTDSPQLKEARKKIAAVVGEWLKQ